jgi:hypothetical protein
MKLGHRLWKALEMAAKALKWWEDPKRHKIGKCAVCNECAISLDGRFCMWGGPYSGYVEVDGNERRQKKEIEREATATQ